MSITRPVFLATAAAGAMFGMPEIGRAEQADLIVNGEGKTYDFKPSLVRLPDGNEWMAWHAYHMSRDRVLSKM